MAPDCYVVLGVSRDANLSQIRRAFRELSHRLDPDHVRPSSDAASFGEVQAAYDALADPTERAAHDRALLAEGRDAAEMPPSSRRPPLGRTRRLFDDFEQHRPSRDDVMRAFNRAYLGPMPKARPMREVGVEVVLSPEQAQSGGVIPFSIPAATPCPSCRGTGRTGFFHCDACGGAGATWAEARVDVVVPRGTPAGTRIPVSLQPLGVGTLFLNVTIRTAPDA